MSDRIDPRRQTREIREALSRFEPDQLLEILTHVFRQYVVEGGAPPAMQLQDELTGLSFAQVIERLQLRLDLPELRLFELQGGRVLVRVDGRLHPLETADSRPEPLPMQRVVNVQPMAIPAAPTPPPAQPPASASPGKSSRETAMPGVHAVGHASGARAEAAPTPARPTATATAARPAAARPAATPAAAPATTPATAPAAAAPARPDKAQTEKPESPGGRFGLLEID